MSVPLKHQSQPPGELDSHTVRAFLSCVRSPLVDPPKSTEQLALLFVEANQTKRMPGIKPAIASQIGTMHVTTRETPFYQQRDTPVFILLLQHWPQC